jgi:DNA polymerase elongation subunit (family B)
MKQLVIDIETVGIPWEEHDPYVREYLIKGMNEVEAEEEKRRGALSPFTGRIIAIGVMNADDGRTCALYEVPGQTELITRKEGSRTWISGTEKQILEKFWDYLGKHDRFISFNGRQFDGPFLMIRSAVHGIVPKRDLVGYRYSFHPNCDLREALNFWGTVNFRQFRFNLDLACKAFGVCSSKSEEKDGRAVAAMYQAGRYQEIADYCLEDVRATCELYLRIAPTLLMWEETYREAEKKRQRPPRPDKPESPAAILSSEQPFLAGITEGSVQLAASLEQTEPEPPSFVPENKQAAILEKLIRTEREEAELLPAEKSD